MDVAPKAGIDVIDNGLVMPAYGQEAENVLEVLLTINMGADCCEISVGDALSYVPSLRRDGMRSACYSRHELRVEPYEVLPQLVSWLEQQCGVNFC